MHGMSRYMRRGDFWFLDGCELAELLEVQGLRPDNVRKPMRHSGITLNLSNKVSWFVVTVCLWSTLRLKKVNLIEDFAVYC